MRDFQDKSIWARSMSLIKELQGHGVHAGGACSLAFFPVSVCVRAPGRNSAASGLRAMACERVSE
jgi:hypothetical protein